MTSESMDLIENFACEGVMREVLGCRVVDEHQQACQECETSSKRSTHILQEFFVQEASVDCNWYSFYD